MGNSNIREIDMTWSVCARAGGQWVTIAGGLGFDAAHKLRDEIHGTTEHSDSEAFCYLYEAI